MTLVSSIIQDAFRESNTIAVGTSPTEPMTTEALRLYNTLIANIYGDDAGEKLQDWPLGEYDRQTNQFTMIRWVNRHEPFINSRMITLNEEAMTVRLPVRPQDGARIGIIDPYNRLASVPITLEGNGRTIEGAPSLLLDEDGLKRTWFYRADLGNWVRLTDLVEMSENPFPQEHDEYFILSLALRLNPRYGREMDDQSAVVYRKARQRFVADYIQSRPLQRDSALSWPFMSIQGYDSQRAGFDSLGQFNSGRII